jgi:predicted nucleotidyltransferase
VEVGNLDALVEKIRECCHWEEAIIAAYLFGSALTGRRRATSDIDVAILVEPEREVAFSFLAFAASLERQCRCPVDLVLLNRAGEHLKFQVRRYGRLIFERDSRKRKEFEIIGRKDYEDFLYLHKRHVRAALYKGLDVASKNG